MKRCGMLKAFPLQRAKWLNKKSYLSFSVDRCIVLHGVRLLGNNGAIYDAFSSSRSSGEIFARKRGFLSDESGNEVFN